MELVEFVIPWIEMQRWKKRVRKEMQRLPVKEPVAERYSITYYNNRKREKRIADTKSAYDRLHDVIPFDVTKPRCDRVKPDLIWAEVHEENKRHIVGMTVNHTYGRPNRTQIDYPDKRFAKSSKTRDFYRSHGILTHDKEKDEPTCAP